MLQFLFFLSQIDNLLVEFGNYGFILIFNFFDCYGKRIFLVWLHEGIFLLALWKLSSRLGNLMLILSFEGGIALFKVSLEFCNLVVVIPDFDSIAIVRVFDIFYLRLLIRNFCLDINEFGLDSLISFG